MTQKEMMIAIFLIFLSLLFGAWALIDGIKKRDWFNLISGIIGLLAASYLICGVLMVQGIIQ